MDIDKCIETLKKGLIINEKAAKEICVAAIEIMAKESQIISIEPPVSVCVPIFMAMQFYDLKQLFKLGGEVPFTK